MKLLNNDLDAVLITSPHNLLYHTGFSGGEGYAVVSHNENILFVDGRYTIQAKSQAENYKVIQYTGDIFAEIAKFNFENLGFEDMFLTYNIYERAVKTMPNTKLVPISKTAESIRQIKREYELCCIKKAQNIGEAAYMHILDYIKPGVTEKEIASEIDYFMRKNGADGNSFDTIAAFGERSALPHAFPTDRKLNNNEFVLMDFGCVFNGYCGDMTRTVHMGKANKEEKEIYNLVLSAQEKAFETIRSGALAKDVDNAARTVFKNAGYADKFNHSLGHGVGVLIHEMPTISPKSESVLRDNTVFSVEPGLYFENKFGVRIEDLVVVNGNGYINLNFTDKKLVEL